MKTSNLQNSKTPSGNITYAEYAKQLYLNDMDVLSNSIIGEFAEKFCAMKKPVTRAMVHEVLMEIDAELYPVSNFCAYSQYKYGKISFPIDTEFSICDEGFCAVFRMINGMSRNSPAVIGKEKSKKKPGKPLHIKSRKAYKEKELACALLAATSLNCVADTTYEIDGLMFQCTMLSLLSRGFASN